MAVTEQTPRNVSTAAAGATVFPYDFKIIAAADLQVQVDGVTKTVDVDFTLSGVGEDAGGDITFLAAMVGGETVTRLRNMAYARASDYQNLGDLRSPTLNNDQDAPVLMIQQVAEVAGRGLHLPVADFAVDTELPAPVAGAVPLVNDAGTGFSWALWGENAAALATLALSTGAALVGWIQSGVGAVLRTVTSKLRDAEVAPEDFGAIGGGIADDTAALVLALATGRVVNGNGRTYGVTGNLRPVAGFAGLRNITLSQLTPSGTSRRTLWIDALTGFWLDRVTVLRNGVGDEHTTVVEMADNAGIWISDCSDFVADYLEASGGGVGTAIVFSGCARFETDRPYAHDMNYVLAADPLDDRVQGIWFNNCSDFAVYKPTAWNLTGNFGGGSTTRYTRGISFGGCSMFDVFSHNVNTCDQGVDLTGTLGNRFWSFHGGKSQNCYTWGFKVANSGRWGRVFGATSEDCGKGGFVVSGQTEVSNPAPHDLRFIGCMAHNIGSNGYVGTIFGFGIEQVATVDATYPRGVKFVDCSAVDDQAVKTMAYGFLNEVENTGFPETNETISCYSEGHVTAAFSGFHKADVQTVPSAIQSIPNDTVTPVDFGTDVYDSSALHDTSADTHQVVIREAGLYLVQAVLQYASNATGRRSARIVKNATLHAGSNNMMQASSVVGSDTVVPTACLTVCEAGDVLYVGAYQDSGAALNTVVAGCVFSVSLLRRD